MPAVIFGQNGPLSGPVRSRGAEVVAQNRNRALGPFEFHPKGPKRAVELHRVLRMVSTLNIFNIQNVYIFYTRIHVGMMWHNHFFPL